MDGSPFSTTSTTAVPVHRLSTGGGGGGSCYYNGGTNAIYGAAASTGSAGGTGGTSTTVPGTAGTVGRVVVTVTVDPTTTSANNGIAAIPTLSEWVMLLMSGLLAGLGLRGMRRKQR